MASLGRTSPTAFPVSAPQYELRARSRGPGRTEYEIWQLPAPATPHVTGHVGITALRGRNRMIAVADGVDAGEREKVGYWAGMAMRRQNPRRVPMVLRCLLTEAGR